MHCPSCKRETYYPNRAGAVSTRPKDAPAHAIKAELRDGTCTKCRRAQKGYKRPSTKGVMTNSHKSRRPRLTVAQEREALAAMIRRRQNRGVPEDGFDPVELQGTTLVTTVTRCYHG